MIPVPFSKCGKYNLEINAALHQIFKEISSRGFLIKSLNDYFNKDNYPMMEEAVIEEIRALRKNTTREQFISNIFERYTAKNIRMKPKKRKRLKRKRFKNL